MIIKDDTCAYYVNLVLSKGGGWRNEEIKQYIQSHFNRTYQNNTIAKYLSFMINDGLVKSRPTDWACYEYWLAQQTRMAI
jgi:hypothetical protein